MRKLLVSTAALAVLSAAGCGGAPSHTRPAGGRAGTPTTAGSASPTVPATTRNLAALLLTLADLPPGYANATANAGDGDSATPPGCPDLAAPAHLAEVAVSFQAGGAQQEISESLDALASADQGEQTMAKARHAFGACRSFTADDVRGTLSQLAFPKLADDSAAFQVTIAKSGLTAHADVVLMRAGTVLAGVANMGARVDHNLTQALARKAADKLRRQGA